MVEKRKARKGRAAPAKPAAKEQDYLPEDPGLRVLHVAWRRWAYEEQAKRPLDAPTRHVAEVLEALITCAAKSSKDDEYSKASRSLVADLASVCRKRGARSQVRMLVPREDGSTEEKALEPKTRVSVIERIEELAGRRHPEAAMHVTLNLLMATQLFGNPKDPPNVQARIQSAIEETAPPNDPEARVRAILRAWGLSPDEARNALKYRDMRAKPRKSIGQ